MIRWTIVDAMTEYTDTADVEVIDVLVMDAVVVAWATTVWIVLGRHPGSGTRKARELSSA